MFSLAITFSCDDMGMHKRKPAATSRETFSCDDVGMHERKPAITSRDSSDRYRTPLLYIAAKTRGMLSFPFHESQSSFTISALRLPLSISLLVAM